MYKCISTFSFTFTLFIDSFFFSSYSSSISLPATDLLRTTSAATCSRLEYRANTQHPIMCRTPVPEEESELDHDIQQGQQTFPLAAGDQLEKEVYGIIDSLFMIESDCVEATKDYAESKDVPTMPHWDALFHIHKMLLNRHHKLFLALQQPSVSLRLQQLPEDLHIPDRLCCRIKNFLILLRSRIPLSPICIEFRDLAYDKVSSLLKIAPAFEDIWRDCLDALPIFTWEKES